ncbi:UNVERIFIED_CONTAM: hypothetical protein Slati_1731100 [Sesamum latifolium]|uniref:Reverse transcriptase n=1 Tax=Sesamum latifolium TaxID=2727402 RepID=A0AAW2WW97_9LAMI
MQELQTSYEGDNLFQSVLQAKILDPQSHPEYKYESGLLRRGNKVSVGSRGGIRERIIKKRFRHGLESVELARHKNNAYPGLLQPLPIPEQVWSYMSMDFIEGLPQSYGKDSISVVVDRLTKYSHFIPLKQPYTAASIAKIFFDNI